MFFNDFNIQTRGWLEENLKFPVITKRACNSYELRVGKWEFWYRPKYGVSYFLYLRGIRIRYLPNVI